MSDTMLPSSRGIVSIQLRQRAPVPMIVGLIGLWLERSRQRRALSELDDRLLKDVGLSRGDAWAEASKPFWR
ncbi:DUF1127 domain-containing protein [Geminicoccaceae bacterium 1502E]|nr:DUF1127 domain-containing protein [Geminicoccaceae bacterium 1502E]